MVVAKILECEPVPKSDKLLRLIVDCGGAPRQVVSGIAAWYTPADLIGRSVVLVENLKPVKLRGVDSNGMILRGGRGGRRRARSFCGRDHPAWIQGEITR